MEQTKGFYDFCIPYNRNDKELRAILNELVELGYKTIAIEQTFDHSKKATAKRSGPDQFPEPHNIKHLQEEFKNQLRILQRLTILYVDGAVSHVMGSSANVKKFNLIAGQPKTDTALTHCCTTFNGDIVTFDSEAGSRLLINRKAYQLAVKRGMFFEIKYAPVIVDSSCRKDMIKTAHNYCTKGKSKSIIFSSGAKDAFQLRSPCDVANLAFIFGLSEDQGKNAIDRFCRQLFLRAESRRIGKTIMFVRCSGPIVFSDSSQSDDGMDNDVDVTSSKKGQTTLADSDIDSSNDEADHEQPEKKKTKLSQ